MNEQKASTLGPAFWLSFSIALSAGMAWQTEHTCDAGWLELYLIGLIFWTIPSIVVGFLVQLFIDLALRILRRQIALGDGLAIGVILLFAVAIGSIVSLLPSNPFWGVVRIVLVLGLIIIALIWGRARQKAQQRDP